MIWIPACAGMTVERGRKKIEPGRNDDKSDRVRIGQGGNNSLFCGVGCGLSLPLLNIILFVGRIS